VGEKKKMSNINMGDVLYHENEWYVVSGMRKERKCPGIDVWGAMHPASLLIFDRCLENGTNVFYTGNRISTESALDLLRTGRFRDISREVASIAT
jgi:hypothetical protein